MLLLAHVLPHVELGPVREREHAHVLAGLDEAVVEVPQLGPLGLGVPLAEVVAEREDALLGPGALLVAAGAAERRLEAVLLDRVEQRDRLEPVARRARARLLDHAAAVDRVLHRGHDQLGAELGSPCGRGTRSPRGSCGRCPRASPGTGARPARTPSGPGAAARPSPCRRRTAARGARAPRPPRGSRGSPPPRGRAGGRSRRSCRPASRRREDTDACARAHTCSPHSVLSCPAQRPSRPAPGSVQGAQPMES